LPSELPFFPSKFLKDFKTFDRFRGTIPPNLSRTITVRVKSRKPLQSSFGKTKLLIQWYGSSSNSEATDKELNIDWNPTKGNFDPTKHVLDGFSCIE